MDREELKGLLRILARSNALQVFEAWNKLLEEFDRLTGELDFVQRERDIAFENCEYLNPQAEALERICEPIKAVYSDGKWNCIDPEEQEEMALTRIQDYLDSLPKKPKKEYDWMCKPISEKLKDEEVLREILDKYDACFNTYGKWRAFIVDTMEHFQLRTE